jgi:tetratricopeptide (TPR) repeat protein
MHRRYWLAALSLWPGLPQIWSGQEVLGLILAALFAMALNLAIVAHLIWTEAFPPGCAAFFTSLAAGTWLAATVYTVWWTWRCHPDRFREQIDRLYRDALDHYLQGRWNDARRRFEQILALDETDADALMHLGTLHMRTGRPQDARRNYRLCLEQEGGAKWRWEIQQALGRLEGPAPADPPPSR